MHSNIYYTILKFKKKKNEGEEEEEEDILNFTNSQCKSLTLVAFLSKPFNLSLLGEDKAAMAN